MNMVLGERTESELQQALIIESEDRLTAAA